MTRPLAPSPKLCVVMWRADVRSPWEVQPFTYSEGVAEIVGGRLVDQFGGEAWVWVGASEPDPASLVLKDLRPGA